MKSGSGAGFYFVIDFFSLFTANYNTVTIEKHKWGDFVDKAVKTAAEWNKAMNQERKEKRQSYFDMQTFVVQRPMNNHGRMKVVKKPKVGAYPVALIPGQFVDHYKTFTPAQLAYLPLNTTLKGPPGPEVTLADLGSEGNKSEEDGEDSSDSDSSDSDSSSGSDSDSSESENEAGESRKEGGKKVEEKDAMPLKKIGEFESKLQVPLLPPSGWVNNHKFAPVQKSKRGRFKKYLSY